MWINHSDAYAYAFGEFSTQHGKFVYYGHNEFAEWPFPVTELQTFFLMAQAFRAVAKGEKLVGTELSA